MPKHQHLHKKSKCKVRLPMMRDTSLPYETHVIKIVNKVFRRDTIDFGNCNWGYVEFLCWGYQVEELKTALEEAGKPEFAEYAVQIELLDSWPSYPINATGTDLTGIDSEMSYPNLIADQRKELEKVTRRVKGIKKTLALLTGSSEKDTTKIS